MKNNNLHRMSKSAGGRTPKKDSGEAGAAAPSRKKPVAQQQGRRRGGGAHDDDDSVDSHGNIRGLIAYSESEEEDMVTEDDSEMESEETTESDLTPEQRATIRKSARKAALKARKRIARRTGPGATVSSASDEEVTARPAVSVRKPAAVPKRKAGVVESDSDEEESEFTMKDLKRLGIKLRRGETVDDAMRRYLKEQGDTSSEEEESEEEEEAPRRRGFLPRRRRVVEEESEDEESEEEDDEYEDDDEEEEGDGRGGLVISIGGFGGDDGAAERMIPRRHNMKKEPEAVRKFVKLVTKPVDEGGIDDQIDEFKRLSGEKQTELLAALDKKPGSDPTHQSMMFRILTMKLPGETQAMVMAKYKSLQAMDPGAGEYFKHRAWLEKLTSLPLGVYKDMPVRLGDGTEACGVFMERARKYLNDAIYGQDEAKLQILQFIASKIANPEARGLSLLLAGPPGIGKTSLIKNGVAKALNWPFQFISLGGDSDATTYTGHQLVYEGSHCGKIANSLAAAKSMSMVLMFDELDKISTTPKGEEVQNLLVHLTDPVQNGDFEDKYLAGVPLDLSHVLFTFSANDLGKIDRVLMDRMVVVQLKGYEEKEKLAIAENFLLPAALREVNLMEKVALSREVLEHIVKEYAGEESGVRELKRCIEQIAQKVNMLRIFNTKDLPFHIPDFQLPFVVKKQHVDMFLKKREARDKVPYGMYI